MKNFFFISASIFASLFSLIAEVHENNQVFTDSNKEKQFPLFYPQESFSLNTSTVQESNNAHDNSFIFEENKGQMKDQNMIPRQDILFSGQSNLTGLTYQIMESGISYQLKRIEKWKEEMSIWEDKERPRLVPDTIGFYRVDVRWINPQRNIAVETGEASRDFTNYYNVSAGVEPATGVRRFQDVTFKNVWQGVDLFYHSKNGVLESDWIVQKAENYTQIKFLVTGAELETDEVGYLRICTPFGEIREGKLKVFQEHKQLAARWIIKGDTVSFAIEGYTSGMPMRIDPPIRLWATYYGGFNDDIGYSCSAEANGDVFLAGETRSTQNIATTGNHQVTYGGSTDAFVVKFDANGVRQWGTYYGGNAMDLAYSCAVDSNGNVYLAGDTRSSQNISTAGSHQSTKGLWTDAFLVKFDANGIRQWGTYYGGNSDELGLSCSVDLNGNVYLVGWTESLQNIASPNAHQSTHGGGTRDAFIAKFNSNGVRQWATYYGGSDADYGNNCKVDGLGNVYFCGSTFSDQGIATTNVHQGTKDGNRDAFLAKFDSNGTRQWATYLGGGGSEIAYSCALDFNGNIFMAGATSSSQGISSVNAHQTTYGGGVWDGFLVKFDATGQFQWGTYYGGSSFDWINSCAVDNNGNIYIGGETNSNQNIASVISYQTTRGGGYDAFLAKFNSNGVRLWGSYYGGNDSELGLSCSVDGLGEVYLAGWTESTQNIASLGAHQTTHGGPPRDAFLVKFYSCQTILLSPQSQTFTTVPGNAWFTCKSHEASATFQWQENPGSGWISLVNNNTYDGTSTDSLHIDGITTAMDGYQYRCIIQACGVTDTTEIATLSVKDNIKVETNHLNDFIAYPNPSKEVFIVKSKKTPYSFEVFDAIGNKVLSGSPKTAQFEIDLKENPNGIYVLKIEVEGKVLIHRLIKMD